MDKVLMIKDNMAHYVPYEVVNDFINCGWKQADLTVKKCSKNTATNTTKKKSKKND